MRVIKICVPAILAMLIFYPPYVRGLFFTGDLLTFHIFSFALFLFFLLYKTVRRDYVIFKAAHEYAVVALITAYLLPLILLRSANTRDAVEGFLKYCNYFLIYLMVRDIAFNRKNIVLLMRVMLLSAVGVAMIGLDAGGGGLGARFIERLVNGLPGIRGYEILGAFQGRIASTIQYENALAAYLFGALMLSAGLTLYAGGKFARSIYTAASFMLISAFIFTYSRGAWLMAPFVFFLFLFLLRRKQHICRALCYCGAAGLTAGAGAPFFYRAVTAQNAAVLWSTVIAGIIIAAILSVAAGHAANLLDKTRSGKAAAAAGIAIISSVIISILLMIHALHSGVPARISNIGAETDQQQNLHRTVHEIEGTTRYVFQYDAEHGHSDERSWSYVIRIYGYNAKNESVRFINANNSALETPGEISFATPPDTERVDIQFTIHHVDAFVEIKNTELLNIETGARHRLIYKYRYFNTLLQRLSDMRMNAGTAQFRFDLYKDTFAMIKDRLFLIGAGGGAWKAFSPMYRTDPFPSTQAHSYFPQVWVEAGLIGIVAWAALLGLLTARVVKWRKKSLTSDSSETEPDLVLTSALSAAALALLIHAIIDFDLAIAAISLVLWQAFALLTALTGTAAPEPRGNRGAWRIIHPALCGIPVLSLLLLAIVLKSGYSHGMSAAGKMECGEMDKAFELYEKAVTRDPFNAVFKMDLADLYRTAVPGTRRDIDRATALTRTALRLEPYNPSFYGHAGEFMLKLGNIDEGLEYINAATSADPMSSAVYTRKAQACYLLAIRNINTGNYNAAEQMLKSALKIPAAVKAVRERTVRPVRLLDNEALRCIDECDYLLRHYKDPEQLAKFKRLRYHARINVDMDIGESAPANFRIQNTGVQGKASNVSVVFAGNDVLRMSNSGNREGWINTRAFVLKPDTDYYIALSIRGRLDHENSLRLMIISNHGQHVQFQQTAMKIHENWTDYNFDFKTTDDLAGTQYLRFWLGGDETGWVELNRAQVFDLCE